MPTRGASSPAGRSSRPAGKTSSSWPCPPTPGPHFTTIADFISSMDKEIIHLFRDVLLVCDDLGLISRKMFAIDGCKLPSNASKEWSGTRADFEKKAAKLEQAIAHIITTHREHDRTQTDKDAAAREKQYVNTLQQRARKIREWLKDNDDKPCKTGKPKKSNITDNESAEMKTSHGVIQGYDGVTTVDSKHQIIVHAEAFCEAQENDLLKPMVNGARENFQAIDKDEDVFTTTRLSADSGFHTAYSGGSRTPFRYEAGHYSGGKADSIPF